MDTSEHGVEAVRVVVGDEHTLVPTGCLQTIVEYRLHADVPFLHPWARGLGQFGEDLFPVVRIERTVGAVPWASVRSALLLRVDGARFLLDVDRVVGFGRCRIIGASHFQTWAPHLPSDWLVAGATEEREVLPTLNAEAVKAALHG